jgi:serine/threonine protein kinase
MTPERWQRVKQVFQGAMERTPGDRGGYLTAEIQGDGELRCEVEKMLLYATGTGLLDTPAWQGGRIECEIEPAARLGPYEILQQVGAGGMGRVYRARDTRLGRTVAIKVLNAEFSHRLRIEGRAISALNHPHVCALYDIGDQDGAAYLVMEYAEGETLKARLASGPLPVDAVLRYGAEIADALAEAHAQGIVHRDLKPANIMITASGAKVLDFGVAQMTSEPEPAAGIAGTAAYMSPSQLNGNPADVRSDIFALGLVLYEMATGEQYSREVPKPLTNLPAGVARVIERCLRQNAGSRVQSMTEVRFALERLRAESAPPPGRRWTRLAQMAALLAMMAATAVLTWKLSLTRAPESPKPSASIRTTIEHTENNQRMRPAAQPSAAAPVPISPAVDLNRAGRRRAPAEPPSLVTLASYPGAERDPSFSPDGTQVAFSWHEHRRNGYAIYVKPVKGDGAPERLTDGSAEDWGPAWSPNGRRIAFRRKAWQSGIYYVETTGGRATQVAPIAQQRQETLPQMSWSHDGNWIAAPDRDGAGTQIFLFGVASGDKRAITSNAFGTDHAPAFSPDGKSLAYASCGGAVYPCDIYVVDLDRNLRTMARRRITDEGIYIRGLAWLANGHGLVYSAGRRSGQDTSLWRISLTPGSIPERIDLAGSRARHPATSPSGGLLAYTRMNTWSLMLIQNFQ